MTKQQEKRILITGAASGLGRAIALNYARRGWQIVVADILDLAGQQVVSEIEALGGRGYCRTCDVASLDDIEGLAIWVREHLGGVDVLVNNAGVASIGTLMEADEAQWQRLLTVNLMSCVRACRSFVPLMPAAGGGHIVNVASFAALALAPGMATYNVAKAGVLALSESLRGELLDCGIGVSVVCPSFFRTNLASSIQHGDPTTLERLDRLMQRSKVTAEDVAADIRRAVDRRQFMVISHAEARFVYRLQRWFPNLAFKLKMRQMRKFMASPPEEQR